MNGSTQSDEKSLAQPSESTTLSITFDPRVTYNRLEDIHDELEKNTVSGTVNIGNMKLDA